MPMMDGCCRAGAPLHFARSGAKLALYASFSGATNAIAFASGKLSQAIHDDDRHQHLSRDPCGTVYVAACRAGIDLLLSLVLVHGDRDARQNILRGPARWRGGLSAVVLYFWFATAAIVRSSQLSGDCKRSRLENNGY